MNDVWSQNYLPALSNYRGGLGQYGGLGLNTSGQASLAGAGTAGSGWEALGAGANSIFNPQPSLEDLLKKYSLNIGGMKWGG